MPFFAWCMTVLTRLALFLRTSTWTQVLAANLLIPGAIGAATYATSDMLTEGLLGKLETYMFGSTLDSVFTAWTPHFEAMPVPYLNVLALWWLVREIIPITAIISAYMAYVSFRMSMASIAFAREMGQRRAMGAAWRRGAWGKIPPT